MDIKKDLEKVIIKALKGLDIKAESVHLEHPVDLKMGDYSSNVAMIYAKNLGKNPKEFAEKIVEKIAVTGMLAKVEVAGPGFINFHLNKGFFEQSIQEVLDKKDNYGENQNLKGQKILIEHSSPNLFKEFHIGHVVNNAIGESISRIIEAQNPKKLTKISYPSDVGLGIAKGIRGIKWGNENLDLDDINIYEVGKGYVVGNKLYNQSEEFKKEVDEINRKIYEGDDSEINSIYQKGKEVSLEYFENIVARLGSKFDDYIFESESGTAGKKLVEEYTPKVFQESQGAVIFKGEDYGLHTRVFLNSNKMPVYEAKDLGLLKLKFDKYNPDLSIFVTDYEQGEYMKVVLKAAEQINPIWSEKTKHLLHGRLRFPEGRLSSREGNVLTANDLLKQTKEEVLKNMKVSDEDKDETAEQVAVGALKYSILKSSSGKNITFDIEKDMALEGNTGLYLQYTYARAKSVLEKAKGEGIESKVKKVNEKISDLEKLIYRFPEIVERAGDEYEPHYIATYLFELAKAFNSFYGNEKIADKENPNASYNVALTESVTYVIKNGLNLLGIESPERL